MLRKDDLDAAVAEGIVTEAQANTLRDFALRRATARAAALGPGERFRSGCGAEPGEVRVANLGAKAVGGFMARAGVVNGNPVGAR